jgi:aerobic-type carbon monoxide dehydrogenase small subunit (CoxS/CutS family)
MAMARINVDGRAPGVDAAPGTPLPWLLREPLVLTGTECGS